MSLMRSPSARCWPLEVTLTRNTWGQDADGGRIVVSATTVRGVDCSVQQFAAEEVIDTNRDTGERVVRQVIPTDLIFPENPGMKADDLVTWSDSDGGPDAQTHIIRCKGQSDACGLRSVWLVKGEERI